MSDPRSISEPLPSQSNESPLAAHDGLLAVAALPKSVPQISLEGLSVQPVLAYLQAALRQSALGNYQFLIADNASPLTLNVT